LDALPAEPEPPELPPLPPLPDDVRLSLAVIAGTQAGSVFPIGKPRLYLGRGANMDVQLKDSEVSRRHAMHEVRDEEATVVDLGSTNGTFVGGQRIERATLANQGEFSLGSTTFMFIVTPLGESS
jgi:pSer/pThr/pTyr-binding forkhead associated (FHA) protein